MKQSVWKAGEERLLKGDGDSAAPLPIACILSASELENRRSELTVRTLAQVELTRDDPWRLPLAF
jgi:hypothetical protein